VDITDAVAPSIDLEQQLFNMIGHGVTRVSDEIRAKRPTAHWTLGRFIGIFLSKKRRANLMRRLTGTGRNAEAFRDFNRSDLALVNKGCFCRLIVRKSCGIRRQIHLSVE
jgi:hypothetical protein